MKTKQLVSSCLFLMVFISACVWFKPRASIVLADLCAHFPRAEDISGMAKFFCFFQQKKAWRFTLNHKGFSLGYDLVYCQNKSRVCLC
ncbi:uncharacterized protein LOC131035780 isoform X2 [Cryptomeria japonica]|uniref:uncharacterized protein LOC131035780 isoform X2 n=1 Tax=Cryptomeria japonica TaxID=3369 RepID=UPI0025AD6998|nr:uncharacterized protein LOC131035780 isoform X2 [Cryptomeria japonica]